MSHERLILNSILNMKCMYLCMNVRVFSIFSPFSYSHSMFFRVPRHIILRLSYHNATCYSPRVFFFSFINIMFSEIWARFSWLFIAENNRKKEFFCFLLLFPFTALLLLLNTQIVQYTFIEGRRNCWDNFCHTKNKKISPYIFFLPWFILSFSFPPMLLNFNQD